MPQSLNHSRSSDGKLIGYNFKCPGCNNIHVVTTTPESPTVWAFNGDLENPTFRPSLLLRLDDLVCHSFVTNGEISFLRDSTHHLAGKKVRLTD